MTKRVLLGLLFAGLTSIAAADDAKWRARVEKELPNALGRLERYYERVQGAATFSEYRPEYDPAMRRQNEEFRQQYTAAKLQQAEGRDVVLPKPPTRKKPEPTGLTQRAKLNFAIRGSLVRLELFPQVSRRYDSTKPAAEWADLDRKFVPFEVVSCTGPKVTFGLRRPAEGDDFFLQNYEAREEVTDAARRYVQNIVFAPFSVNSTPLWNVINDKSYRLTNVTEVVSHGRVCCKVEYDYNPETNSTIRGGFAILSPEEGWQIHAAENRGTRMDIAYRSRIDYAEGVVPIPFPRLVSNDLGDNFRHTMEFERIEAAEVPAEAFSLMHYGLPDLSKPLRDLTIGR